MDRLGAVLIDGDRLGIERVLGLLVLEGLLVGLLVIVGRRVDVIGWRVEVVVRRVDVIRLRGDGVVRRVDVIRLRDEGVGTVLTWRGVFARLDVLTRPFLDAALFVETVVKTLGRDAVRVALLFKLRVDVRTEVLAVVVVRDVRPAGVLMTTRGRDAVRPLPLVVTIRGVRDTVLRGVAVSVLVMGLLLVAVDVVNTRDLAVERVVALPLLSLEVGGEVETRVLFLDRRAVDAAPLPDIREVRNVDVPTAFTSARFDVRDAVLGGRRILSRLRSISMFGSVRGTTDELLVDESLRAVAAREVVDAICSEPRP